MTLCCLRGDAPLGRMIFMRLTVVGCAGSFPGPDSPASCYLLEADGFRVVIDFGNGSLGALQKYTSLFDIDAVCLSHLHADHCVDLYSYSVARTFSPAGPQPAIPVYGPARTAERMSLIHGLDGDDLGLMKRFTFETLAPGKDQGWGHVGPAGAGHFVKMVHNAIEYGMMQAYAEGFSILKHKEEFELDLAAIGEIWRVGSVIRSWLLDLTTDALHKNPSLDGLEAYVVDSGEGRWTVFEAIDLNVAAPVITESLLRRIRSREENNFSDRMLAVMRNAFGGHAVKKA